MIKHTETAHHPPEFTDELENIDANGHVPVPQGPGSVWKSIGIILTPIMLIQLSMSDCGNLGKGLAGVNYFEHLMQLEKNWQYAQRRVKM